MAYQLIELIEEGEGAEDGMEYIISLMFSYPNFEAILAAVGLEGQACNYLIDLVLKAALYIDEYGKFDTVFPTERVLNDLKQHANPKEL